MAYIRVCLYVLVIVGTLWYLVPDIFEGWSAVITSLAIMAQIYRKRIVTYLVAFGVLALIPSAIKIYFKSQFTFGKRMCERLYERAKKSVFEAWRKLHWIIRVAVCIVPLLLAATMMFIAGGTLWVVTVLPAGVASLFATNFIRAWLLPMLARKALGTSMNKLVPFFWGLLPKPVQKELHRRYYRLWWKTVLKLMRSKRMAARKARKLKDGWHSAIMTNPLP